MAASMIKTIRRNAKTYSFQLAGTNTFDNDGFATISTTLPANISAVIQPMGSKELRNVPEGQNTLQWITIWSEINLALKGEITYGGVVFTVQNVEFWDDGGFYIARATHLED